MFFEVERILKDKRPKGFILENVEGLVNHDGGRTLQVIVDRLAALNYKFDFRVLNSKYFGVPQERKRIYIVGSVYETPNLDNFAIKECKLGDILESGLPTADTPFTRTLVNVDLSTFGRITHTMLKCQQVFRAFSQTTPEVFFGFSNKLPQRSIFFRESIIMILVTSKNNI